LKYKTFFFLAYTLLAPKLINAANTQEQKGPYWIKEINITQIDKEVSPQDVEKVNEQLASLHIKAPIYLSQQTPFLKKICQTLYEAGYVTQLEAHFPTRGVYIRIKIKIVTILKRIKKIQWVNISLKEQAELNKFLDFQPNSVHYEHYKKILESRLKKYYARQGHLKIKVNIEQKNATENTEILIVKIKKGSKNYLEQVYFTKNHALTPEKLHNLTCLNIKGFYY